MNLLAIDTGLEKIGFAYWAKQNTASPKRPTFAGVFKHPRADTHLQHSCAINGTVIMRALWNEIGRECDRLDLVRANRLVCLIVEGQQIRKDAVGLAAGGDVINLATVAGAMIGWHAMSHNKSGKRYQARILQPKDWKGQMSKETVSDRITRMIGDHDASDTVFKADAWDAVGIGLVAQGHSLSDLNKVKRKG